MLYSCQKDSEILNQNQNEKLTTQRNIPLIEDDMLSFSSEADLDNYLKFLDGLSEHQRDVHDDNLGFDFLGDQYVSEEGAISQNTITDFIVLDPDLQSVLNEYYEIKIGEQIYKYIDRYVQLIVHENELNYIMDIRSQDFYLNENSVIKNLLTNEEISISNVIPQAAAPIDCSILLFQSPLESQGSSSMALRIWIVNENGELSSIDCSFDVTLSVSVDGEPKLTEELNVSQFGIIHSASLNDLIEQGSCEDVTLSVVLNNFQNCGTCSESITSQTYIMNFCNEFECEESPAEDEWVVEDIEYNGSQNRAVMKMGYILRQSSIFRSKLWSQVIHYRKKNNGNWTRSRPDYDLSITHDGEVYFNCDITDGITPIGYPIDQVKKERRKSIKITFRNGSDLYLRSDPNPALSRMKVFHTNPQTPNVEGEDIFL